MDEFIITEFEEKDLLGTLSVWNEVVNEKNAFPQEEPFDEKEGLKFFLSQSKTAVLREKGRDEILGMYILHPNNVGRCGHIANASYAVKSTQRGRHIGEALVTDCKKSARELGFLILQFNAVVKTNTAARHLYEKLGFINLGTIKNGFRMGDGTFEDICPYYIEL